MYNIKYKKHLSFLLITLLILGNMLTTVAFADTINLPIEETVSETNTVKEKTELIVKYKDETNKEEKLSEVKEGLGLAKLETVKKIDGFDLVEIAETDDIQAVITELEKDQSIEYVQPNYKLFAFAEPRFSEQWGLKSDLDVNAQTGWKITKGEESLLVGVLDTGIDVNHEDLANNIYINTNEIAGNGIDDDGNGYVDDVNGWDFTTKTTLYLTV